MKIFVDDKRDEIILEHTSKGFTRTITLKSSPEDIEHLETLMEEEDNDAEVSKFLQEKMFAQIEEVKKSIKVKVEAGTMLGNLIEIDTKQETKTVENEKN